MNRMTTGLIVAMLLLGVACEKPAPPAEPATATQVPAEKIVTEEIPEDLRAEAAKEITAENADKMAAELEAEIDSDLE